MQIDRSDYPGVPEDFPISATSPQCSTPARASMDMVAEGGKYYFDGSAPSQVQDELALCEDLIYQFVPYCHRNLASHAGDRQATLKAALSGLLTTQWCTPEHSRRVITSVARHLDWEVEEGTLDTVPAVAA